MQPASPIASGRSAESGPGERTRSTLSAPTLARGLGCRAIIGPIATSLVENNKEGHEQLISGAWVCECGCGAFIDYDEAGQVVGCTASTEAEATSPQDSSRRPERRH